MPRPPQRKLTTRCWSRRLSPGGRSATFARRHAPRACARRSTSASVIRYGCQRRTQRQLTWMGEHTSRNILSALIHHPGWGCVMEVVASLAATTSLAQGTAQGGGEFGDLPLRHLGGQDGLRAMERAGPLVQLNRHAGLQQAQRVADAFIAERIELRG